MGWRLATCCERANGRSSVDGVEAERRAVSVRTVGAQVDGVEAELRAAGAAGLDAGTGHTPRMRESTPCCAGSRPGNPTAPLSSPCSTAAIRGSVAFGYDVLLAPPPTQAPHVLEADRPAPGIDPAGSWFE